MASEYTLDVYGHATRVLEHGDSRAAPPVVFFAGIGGLPRPVPFLAALAQGRRVLAPSLPGFPGAEAFRHLDGHIDWIVHAVETVEALAEAPVDLVGSSVGGALAAEVAALAGHLVRRLVLIAPFGCFDANDPAADIWAQPPGPDALPNLVCEDPENWRRLWEVPADAAAIDWQVLQTRAMEAAARLLFPFGDTGVLGRLHRVNAPTLLLRGAKDRVLPASYNARFADALAGPVTADAIADAGHLPELDAPDALARRIHAFLADQALP